LGLPVLDFVAVAENIPAAVRREACPVHGLRKDITKWATSLRLIALLR
jgi:hypothetical protein